jgi:hypothetical protein
MRCRTIELNVWGCLLPMICLHSKELTWNLQHETRVRDCVWGGAPNLHCALEEVCKRVFCFAHPFLIDTKVVARASSPVVLSMWSCALKVDEKLVKTCCFGSGKWFSIIPHQRCAPAEKDCNKIWSNCCSVFLICPSQWFVQVVCY